MLELLSNSFEEVRRTLRPEFLGEQRLFLDGLEPVEFGKSVLTLRARHPSPSPHVRDLACEHFSRSMSEHIGTRVRIRILAAPRAPQDPTRMDPIVDRGNRTAVTVLEILAKGKQPELDPIFIHGPRGCGKTHLVEHFVRRAIEPVNLWKALDFQDAVARTMRAGDFPAFRDSLLKTRFFVLDEVHRLRGKTRTQQELAFLMDSWKARGTRVLFVGRHHPKQILDLGGQLASRFLGGFTIDIKMPEAEARYEFLWRHGIARERVRREIPEALRPSLGYADLRDLIQDGQAKEAPAADASARRVEACVERVAQSFGVPAEELRTRNASRKICLPRQVLAYLLVEAGTPRATLARTLGWKSASSVHYAISCIRKRMAEDRNFRELVEGLDLG